MISELDELLWIALCPELNIIVPQEQLQNKGITLFFLGNMPITIYLYINVHTFLYFV